MAPFFLESYTSQVPRVSPPISAPPSADQFGVFEPNQLNVAVGMASLRPPGFEQPRYGVPPSVQAVSSPQPFAQQSTSATAGTVQCRNTDVNNEVASGYQYSTPRPPNPFACSLVASKKVADAAGKFVSYSKTRNRHKTQVTDYPWKDPKKLKQPVGVLENLKQPS